MNIIDRPCAIGPNHLCSSILLKRLKSYSSHFCKESWVIMWLCKGFGSIVLCYSVQGGWKPLTYPSSLLSNPCGCISFNDKSHCLDYTIEIFWMALLNAVDGQTSSNTIEWGDFTPSDISLEQVPSNWTKNGTDRFFVGNGYSNLRGKKKF